MQQPPMIHDPMVVAPTPVQQPVTAQSQAAKGESQHREAANGSLEATAAPAPSDHGVKEFYTPGAAL